MVGISKLPDARHVDLRQVVADQVARTGRRRHRQPVHVIVDPHVALQVLRQHGVRRRRGHVVELNVDRVLAGGRIDGGEVAEDARQNVAGRGDGHHVGLRVDAHVALQRVGQHAAGRLGGHMAHAHDLGFRHPREHVGTDIDGIDEIIVVGPQHFIAGAGEQQFQRLVDRGLLQFHRHQPADARVGDDVDARLRRDVLDRLAQIGVEEHVADARRLLGRRHGDEHHGCDQARLMIPLLTRHSPVFSC
jgi:hypothetical protein